MRTTTFRPLRLLSLLGAHLLVWLLLLGHPGAAQASLLHFSGAPPADLGLHDGRLRPCPSPAHCARQDWPLANPAAALQQLALELETTPGVQIEARVGSPQLSYLHATAESRLFGFVDDLELALDASGTGLQARSESRLGDSDLGVNARRLEGLRLILSPAGGG
ncbi:MULTISPECIES: DUF1499 domain-containing protein [unclassified Synechococcus]|uniref:DUF1499 domain-containing protein n=1 Tax=unclassified Synechococcus TaxID=2626047 RepID=UPI0000699A4C|nr:MULTISPECIES: DUF1499 domain-containing protein [unclassified Synechococcus]EAQ76513.1 hypothetical protein WH5701_04560 [Synechococcus sp. WH 5701]WFN59298.1 DUF1499 domain-containing protein [Synechococcus sp. CCFWC 502]